MRRGSPDKLESMLRQKRAELVADYERCLASLREPENVNYNDGEGVELDNRAETAFTVGHLSREIRAIDDALQRLARGEYGICVTCREPISSGRLAAQPTAVRCVRCQDLADRRVG